MDSGLFLGIIDMRDASLFVWFELFWIFVATPGMFLYFIFFAPRLERGNPPGYIGRFRRPDGKVVHVGRLPSGAFCVLKDRPWWSSKREPEDLGTVAGRELVNWTKLSDTPDGKDRVAGAR